MKIKKKIIFKILTFLLIFLWIFSDWPQILRNQKPFFQIKEAQALGVYEGDGLAIYGQSGNSTPLWRTYSGPNNSFGSATSTVSGAVGLQFRIQTSPIKQEAIAGYMDTSGNLYIMCYNGTSWSNEWSVSIGGNGSTRRFDIAYESQSGDVMVVYSTNVSSTNELAYRTKSGSSNCGSDNWSSATNIDAQRTSGTVLWVSLASQFNSSSNLIGLAWLDSNGILSAMGWTGSSWSISEPSSAFNTIALEYISSIGDMESFGIAIESISGYIMVTWSVNGAGCTANSTTESTTCARYARYTTSWSSVSTVPTVADRFTTMAIAADYSSNLILLAGIANDSSDLSRAVWSGTSWTGSSGDTSCATPVAGSKFVAVGWLVSGTNTRGVLVYYDSNATNIGWNTVSGTTWTAQTDWAPTPSFGTQRYYDIIVDPINKDRLMFIVGDANSDFFAKRLILSGTSFTWSNADGGAALEANGTSASYPFFAFAYWRYIPREYNQSSYRFFANVNSTDVGTPLADQNTPATLSYSGENFRLRLLLHIDYTSLPQSGESFKLQFGTSTGGSCTSSPPSIWSDVTTSTPISFYDNSTPSDGAALTANANDPTHGSDTIVNQTYEELNNFTNSVAAIPFGQDGKWDFSLKDNNSTPTVATYCLRVVKSDGSLLDTYSVTPQITTSNVTSWVTGSLGKTTDSWYGAIPVYMEVHGDISTSTYPYARAMVQTPISETYYTSMNWNNTTNRFEGVIYVGSWYCNGCADPNTGTYTVTVQLDNDPNFGSIDYSASAGNFSTFITRRWNAVSTSAMGYGTEFNPTWNESGGYWDYSIEDFSLGGSASARTNVAFAIPFHPTTANISNISVTLGGNSIPQGSPASTTDCWWWDSNTHTLYVQKASVAASTYYTVNLSFRSDTDLFMTRVDRVYTDNMDERLFSNGILFGNNYINTVVFGCGHEGEGEQIELTGRNFSNNDDVNLDCMERVAVHVDNTIRADTSGYYAADIKWKPNQCTNWIVSEDNDKIVWRVVSDDTPSTGWAQQLNNYISATRTQEFYANKRYLKNIYEFKNNDSNSHIYPMVWGREQWLGTDRNTNDRGRYAGDTSYRIPETHILMSTSTLPETWFTTYDIGVYAAMGVIFQENASGRYGYFLTAAALTNASPWAEWVNYGSEYRVDDQQTDATGESDNIFFDAVWNNVSPNQTVSLTFWQWGYVTTSWDTIEKAIRDDYYETGGVKIIQSGYRFFENQNSTDVGSPLANPNTPASLTSTGQSFRLRMLFHIDTNELIQNGRYLKLQYAQKNGANCGDDETFTDVTATSTISFYDNSTPSNGDALTTNSNDPTHGTDTVRAQTYVEANNFINTQSMVNIGEDSLWDFSLKDNGAEAEKSYCFRAVKANISNSNYETIFYNYYPEITTAPLTQSLNLTISTSTIDLGVLAPQIPVSATTTATVEISGYSNGYYLAIKRNSATSTLALQTDPLIIFPDYSPSWDPTANSGSGNATTTPGSVFSFRLMNTGTNSNYNSTWWGLNDNIGTAKFAGMPANSTMIMTCSTSACQNGTTTNVILYRADAPIIQPIGNYTGEITITALGNL